MLVGKVLCNLCLMAGLGFHIEQVQGQFSQVAHMAKHVPHKLCHWNDTGYPRCEETGIL